jgi:hypothetical protein|tara:strand:- start:587 stop:991 length:405 start_codon:yes stop_codon:yes gene_type:complete
LVKLPVCFESRSTATIFRKMLDEIGHEYKRKNVSRSYTRVAVVIALERTALVHRYEIGDGGLIVDIWEEKPSSGSVTYIEIRGGGEAEQRELLQRFSEKLPRRPWEYTFGQKLRNGWLSQGIMGAKKSWHKVIG